MSDLVAKITSAAYNGMGIDDDRNMLLLYTCVLCLEYLESYIIASYFVDVFTVCIIVTFHLFYSHFVCLFKCTYFTSVDAAAGWTTSVCNNLLQQL